MSFDEWFKHYPKKVSIGSARPAYSNAILFRNATEEQLLDAVKAFAKLCQGIDRQFIPKPCNWLNEERWHDEDIQLLIEKDKEKKELHGWRKQISEALGYETYRAYCQDANFEDGVLIASSAFKANYLKNNLLHALEKAGVKHVRITQ